MFCVNYLNLSWQTSIVWFFFTIIVVVSAHHVFKMFINHIFVIAFKFCVYKICQVGDIITPYLPPASEEICLKFPLALLEKMRRHFSI